jgi:hypothetical protein
MREKIDEADATANAPRQRTQWLSDTQRITFLVIGDAVVFLVFAAIGRRSHGEGSGLGAIMQVVVTAIPFAIGWFLVSPFIGGAFRRGLEGRPGEMARRTALAWLAAWPVSMALRGIFVDHAVPPLSFAVITLISNTILLLAWRVPFAFITRRLRR